MERAIINKTVAPINLNASFESEMADEALYGMLCTIDSWEGEFAHVKMDYNYSGYIHKDNLIIDKKRVTEWEKKEVYVVWHPYVDVYKEPTYKTYQLQNLTRGARIHVTGKVEGDWTEVELADSRLGYLRTTYIKKLYDKPVDVDEAELRDRLVETAKLYLGSQYRWGGRSPLGLDCSGLCSIAYYLNGITIYRDANLKDEYMDEIKFEDIKKADLLFFPGHVAMYLGDDKFIHSSGTIGGVGIQSFNSSDKEYREDLKKTLYAAGSVFKNGKLR